MPTPKKDKQQIALNLLRKGLSVKEIAEKLGVSRQVIYNWDAEAGGVMKKRAKSPKKPIKGVIASAIDERVSVPDPEDIRRLRQECNLSIKKAAEMVMLSGRYTTWMGYERPRGHKDHHEIPLATWELFLLLTGRHPSLKVGKRYGSGG